MGRLEITEDTKVSEILEEYGDIADVMEALGMKRVGGLSFRRVITKAITVKRAAQIHRVPVDELMEKLDVAVAQIEAGDHGATAEIAAIAVGSTSTPDRFLGVRLSQAMMKAADARNTRTTAMPMAIATGAWIERITP